MPPGRCGKTSLLPWPFAETIGCASTQQRIQRFNDHARYSAVVFRCVPLDSLGQSAGNVDDNLLGFIRAFD